MISDDSSQDSAATADNSQRLLRHLQSNKKIILGVSTLMESTDGCAASYCYSNALFLLCSVACSQNFVIDRAVSAQGHGKGVVDGLNAVDKRFLRTCSSKLSSDFKPCGLYDSSNDLMTNDTQDKKSTMTDNMDKTSSEIKVESIRIAQEASLRVNASERTETQDVSLAATCVHILSDSSRKDGVISIKNTKKEILLRSIKVGTITKWRSTVN